MGLGNKIKRIREGVEIDKLTKNLYGNNSYLEGYVFVEHEKILDYAMLAKSFSTEYGKPSVWIEDIYLKPEYCGMGIGTKFFDFIDKKYQEYIFRLEVEAENERAVHVYQKSGFTVLPYLEMKKE